MKKSCWFSVPEELSGLYLPAKPVILRCHLMPSELKSEEEFLRLSEKASECRVKRSQNVVKLKLRTPGQLYTIKVDPERAGELMKQVKCEIIEA